MADFFDNNLPSPRQPSDTINSEFLESAQRNLRNHVEGLVERANQQLLIEGKAPLQVEMLDQFIEDIGGQITELIERSPDNIERDYKFNFDVEFRPLLKLFETPYCKFEPIKVYESPPVAPVVFIYPLLCASDKYVIWITPS